MATYTVLESSGGYVTLQVEFADQTFVQIVVTTLTGASLKKMLQKYSDTYEAEWLALQGVVNGESTVVEA